MAVWIKTEDADFIRYERSDGQAGYRIYKHAEHFHAEQWMPWAEARGNAPPEKSSPSEPMDIASWFERTLSVAGDSVSIG